jgi:DNA replication licensing factor MCM2
LLKGGKGSIEVCYSELAQGEQTLAFFLPEAPQELLNIFDQGLKDVVGVLYKNYKDVKADYHIRISNLPLLENIRTLRQLHLNQMVSFTIFKN